MSAGPRSSPRNGTATDALPACWRLWTCSLAASCAIAPTRRALAQFLKKDSDCKFQKYAAEAILKHVDLKKTSH